MLDELGRAQIRFDDGRMEVLVDALHGVERTLGVGADDDAVRAEEVVHRAAFPQEFGVGDHVEIDIGRRIARDGLSHFGAGAHWHRRFVGNDAVAVFGLHAFGQLARNLFNVGEVYRAVYLRGRRHGDKDDFTFGDGTGNVRREGQATRACIAPDHVFQIGLVDRRHALLEHFDLAGIAIDAKNPVPVFGEARTRG